MRVKEAPWYADIANYLSSRVLPNGMIFQQKRKFFSDLKFYFWEEPFLYKHCADQMIRRCVLEEEMESILRHCHEKEVGGHFGGTRTTAKVLQSGFYWPTLFKDPFRWVQECDQCQRSGNILKRDEMLMSNILVIELLTCGGLTSWALSRIHMEICTS